MFWIFVDDIKMGVSSCIFR